MKNKYLGIDLGTTYSVGAYVDDDGTVKTVKNIEEEDITPSVVYFESKDSVIVGDIAKKNAYVYPGSVVSLVKNSMGKKNKDGSNVLISTDCGEYTPEVVSSFILKKIVSDANVKLGLADEAKGEKGDSALIKDVVVTIPAYFTDAQRKATDNAISIAGLNRIGMINEPTAAALYYAEQSKLTEADILVYDLGGGTFDVTIVHLDHGNVEVRSTGGLSKVGGSFFDEMIVEKLCSMFLKDHKIDLTDSGYEEILQALYQSVEAAKIQLSTTNRAQVSIMIPGVASERYVLSRDDIEDIVKDLYQKTESVMKKALREAKLDKGQIDKIILVGGSSRIPYIIDHVRDYFGKEPSREVDGNKVVAMGAALYAKQLVEGQSKKIVDVCSHGIGLRALDPKTREEYNDILIKRNTKLPAVVEKAYLLGADDAPTLYLSVLEGDYKEVTDVTEICEVDVELPKKLLKGTRIVIRLEIDVYQLLHIYIRIPDAGNVETEVTFDRKSNMSEAEVTKWKKSVETAVKNMDEKNGIFGGFFKKLGLGKSAATSDEEASSSDVYATEDSGNNNIIRPEMKKEEKKKEKSNKYAKIVMSSMEGYVGLEEVAFALDNYKSRMDLISKRGREEDDYLCFAICGQPGVGVTTSAKIVANCLYKLGAVSQPNPVWATYETIVQADEQSTIAAIQNLFQSAMNGVLIIDDFHEFYNVNESAAGMMAINYLLKAYMEAQKNVTLIVAGYSKEVKDLFAVKKKFRKLFSSFTIDLVGYSSDQYVEILHSIANKTGYVVDNYADTALERHIKGESKLPGFEHIHYIEDMLDKAKTDVAKKAGKKRRATDEDFSIIRQDNFQLVESEKSLEELLEELHGMIGLQSVKKQVDDMVKTVQMRQRAIAEGKELPEDEFTLHTVFVGNAGTGKTTVARLVGDIYRELGALTKGQMIEVLRKDLVSEFVGKTSQTVADKVQEAMGGILFIDEAYDLCKDDQDSFGLEAVNALVPLLENHRTEFMTIIAGYTDDMRKFLDNNQGLKSRFANVVVFEDYTLDELMQIFQKIVLSKNYSIEERALESVREILAGEMRKPDFGNGRGVRNLFQKIVIAQKQRVSEMTDWGENEQLIIRQADCVAAYESLGAKVSKEDVLKELDAMTGLTSVKAEVRSLVNQIEINELRKKAGASVSKTGTLHMVFAGNPGTGKTTVARMIGKLYQAIGVLPRADVIEVKRADLVGQYVGTTAKKTVDVVRSALGAVLFIDEAYQLGEGGEGDFGREAIETLVQELENHKDDFVCIVAGYTEEMQKKFMDVNPGLRSRFPKTIVFEDYTVAEKLEIFEKNISSQDFVIGDGVLPKVQYLLEQVKDDPTYVNGRGVRTIGEKILSNVNNRIAQMYQQGKPVSKEDLTTVLPEDIWLDGVNEEAEDSESTEALLEQLFSMTGLAAVKKEVNELVNTAKMNAMRKSMGLPPLNSSTLHMVFAGNPGTGKTTVARMIGKIYKSLGVIKRSDVLEVKRPDLVGQYVGHTAQRTVEAVQKAMGGVLFIDEAYQLGEGGENDFGREAINTLVQELENHRDDFVCIVAGYTDDMERKFMSVNPGLKSRFPHTIMFEDYSIPEKLEIFAKNMSGQGFILQDGVLDMVQKLFEIYGNSDQYANARGVRTIGDEIIKHMNERVLRENIFTKEAMTTIKIDDVYL